MNFAFRGSNVRMWREKYQTNHDFLPEPGYYKDNDFGIRIEDIVVVVPVHTKVGAEWPLKTDSN